MATLIVGLTFGFLIGAQYLGKQNVQAHANANAIPPQRIEEITPGISTATFAANLVMAHQIEADSLVVNGYDMIKMQENLLNYLATRPMAERADIENIVNRSRAEVFYKIKQPTPPTPAEQKQDKPK
jgi:hypothetical protein